MLIVLTIVVRSSAFECVGAILCQQIGALVMADSILLQSKYTDPKTLLLDFLSLVILLLLIIETPFKYPCKAT